ncbi:peptidylprolyl isomerase [Segetibacter aerophilus]|uniref:PpiC domain-containing protein n=1 Tax=Segetibacter aerophilus TaxID=670293 RepID=A0A512BHZ9_9BACT|nr:peptidylprolyl isomerase [Segetibacter aerophilus]GEO11495.1 hypothetical protein SAE01_39910 [Segetibacter aerophilus]
MKKFALALGSVLLVSGSFAQTIFTYGNRAVTKDEFVSAFNKNPTAAADRKKSLKEYLDLYINFKLKVQGAYDAGLDKDATQQFELQNFKKQVADNIINDEANVKALVQEAFERSRKDIHLQQVFIEVAGNADTTEAYKKIQTAYKQLKDGKEFGSVAQEFATDEATKQSKGDLGFITVFTLPYDIETIAYNLKANSFSSPVKTKAGYHIFKNVGERKSSGTRRVAQILVAVPPNATIEDKKLAARKADSLYNLVKSGVDFGELAFTTSDDVSSNNNRGELPEFSTGTYDAPFENTAFSLKEKGDVSKPFQTAYGFHILKLLEARTAAGDLNDPAIFAALQEKVVKSNRLELSKKQLIQKKLSLLRYKPAPINSDNLYAFTNDALKKNTIAAVKGINLNTPIFSFAKQTVKAGDWINFVKNSSNTSYLTSKDNYQELYKDFISTTADKYYRDNLDVYSSDFSKQVKEFKEANLLFGIMEKNVWGKANTDTAGLVRYYNQHKSKYVWEPSADVIIVTCNKETLANDLQQKLKGNLNDWRQITSSNGTDISADSGRYELAQLPVTGKTNFVAGLITAPFKNNNDGTYTFNYLIKTYDAPAQRSFDDARGLVISDYQQVLENKWIAELKKKYPVKVNEAVFQSIK